jgi:hypothetical protein
VDVDEARVVADGLARAVREGTPGLGGPELPINPAAKAEPLSRSFVEKERVEAALRIEAAEREDPAGAELSSGFAIPVEGPAGAPPFPRAPSRPESAPSWESSDSLFNTEVIDEAETVCAPWSTSGGMTVVRAS